MRRLLVVAFHSARETRREVGALIGLCTFLLFVMTVFSNIWAAINQEGTWKIDPARMVWYFTFTELVAMSTSGLALLVENDIQTGRVTYLLARPLGYFRQRGAEIFGIIAVRFSLLAIVGTIGALLLTGSFPCSLGCYFLILLLIFLGIGVITLQQITLGACTYWLGEIRPLSWFYNKLLFVLGGMMVPLHFYPMLFAKIALLTPFAAVMYCPASLLFGENAFLSLEGVLFALGSWLVGSFLVAWYAITRAIHYATVTGK